jgi:hypothetical protein
MQQLLITKLYFYVFILIYKETTIVVYNLNLKPREQEHKGEDIIHEGKNKSKMNFPKSN